MRIKIENVIWQLAKAFRKKFAADHPGLEINMSVAAVAAFNSLKANGHAEEYVDSDGATIWKATPKFLTETGLEPGPFVVLGPGVH